MAQPGLSKDEKRRTLAALKKCGNNQSAAAMELGLSRGTLKSRVESMRAEGVDIPGRPVGLHTSGGGLGRKLAAERARRESAEKRADMLQADLERARAAKPPAPVVPRRRKREKEDRVAVVFPDVHGAHSDPEAVAAFLGDVESLDPDIVVGLGDLVDCGGFLAQHQTLGFVAEMDYSYEDDIKAAAGFLNKLQMAAPHAEFHAIEGNHDHRPEKWAVTAALRHRKDAERLRKQNAPNEVLGFKERGIHYYRRAEQQPGTPVQGSFRVGKLLFAHGILNGNSTPDQVLTRFGVSVAYGHTHQMASKVRPGHDGKSIGAWNLGTLARKHPLYAHSSPTLWTHGYGVFVFSRSGNFQPIPVTIVDGVSLLPDLVTK